MDFQKKFPLLGDYFIVKSLGTGLNSKVKLGYNKQDGKYYAVKIMKNTGKVNLNQKAINTEVSIMSNLHHNRLINLVKQQTIDDLVKPNGKTKKVLYIVLEYAPGGELFDYVANTGSFKEEIARFYFNQLLQAVEYLHSQNFSHRDLKPENILLDGEFNLKLADFGFTTQMAGHDGSGKLKTQLGTESYMAPEIHLKLTYSGVAIDLFAVGIILFVLYSGNPPFNRADPKDIYFKQLCTNKHPIFWEAHLKFKENKQFYSEGFKSIINSLLAFDPTQRMTLAELKTHPWVTGKQATLEQVQQEMLERKKKINIIQEKNRVQKALIKEQTKTQQQKDQTPEKEGVFVGFQKFRGGIEQEDKEFSQLKASFPTLETQRKLYSQEKEIQTKLMANNAYSDLNPSHLFYSILKFCAKKFTKVTISEEYFKIICENQSEEFELIQFAIKICEYDNNLNSIEFERKSGPMIQVSLEIIAVKQFINSI